MSRSLALMIMLGLLSMPLSAYAYIDPNAGGGVFQLLAPLFAALIALWVYLKSNIKRFVAKIAAKVKPKVK